MPKYRPLVITYILGHFLVDFACAFLMFRIIKNSQQWYTCLLLYNFCAFALQMPIGLIADRWNRNAVCAALGCALVAVSFGLGGLNGFAATAAVMTGIGNGLFHIGGGIDILNISKGKPSLLGIYVAPGALGIFLGTMTGKQTELSAAAVITMLVILSAYILAAGRISHLSFHSENAPVTFKGLASKGFLPAVILLLTVVCLRSYLGLVLNFAWKSRMLWAVLTVCAVVIGKAAGGFLAEKFGVVKASVISLGLSAVLFLFSGSPLAGVLAVFFFNMTMPITLWAAARLLPGCMGFSFGFLTFGLFIGFVPVYLGLEPLFTESAGYAAAAVISFVLLWFGLRKEVV